MSETKLEAVLGPLVRRYGLERVERCLRQMESPDRRRRRSSPAGRSDTSSGNGVAAKPGAKNSRVSATEYADKMEIPSMNRPAVADLARRFENKSFLPTYRDVVDFCKMYGIDVPASRSRTGAIPRVFKFIAGMEADDIQGILDRGMFSGPSELGPISDAIRHRRQRDVAGFSSATRTDASSSSNAEVDGVQRQP